MDQKGARFLTLSKRAPTLALMAAPLLTPPLKQRLDALAQTLSFDDRAKLLAALDHIARVTKGDTKPIARLTDPRVPMKARQAVCAVTPFGFDAPWLAAHQKPWAENEKYDHVLKAATATAIHAITSPAMDDLPRYRTELLHNVIWLMTVAPYGKYTVRYRSRGVLIDSHATLVHEHVFTRKSLADELLAAKPGQIEDVLRTRAVACIVTAEEHNRLKPFDQTHQGWERYREAGIEVIDMLNGSKVSFWDSRGPREPVDPPSI